jgi:transcriptional regulator with PAS, ATPase and Fis domain
MREAELAAQFEWCWQNFGIVTRHEPLLDLLGRAAKLALSDAPILITGETGTGKELVAAGIHRLSKVKGEYVPVNCAAVPKEMIETELFGHARGAFSGAIGDRIGLVEVAAEGTLFLDEVGEMSEPMQAKLLRFLESGEYRRVGESANRRVKERVIGATNVPREELAKGEGFRRDLYWRLAHGVLEVPPLRRRPGDAMLLLDHFLRIESRKMNKPHLAFSAEARSELERYAWPGNVRELMGVVRRAVALAEHTIEREHLELTPSREVANSLTEEIAETERIRIDRAMRENRNSPTAAARALGIPRTTLVMKLKRMKLR